MTLLCLIAVLYKDRLDNADKDVFYYTSTVVCVRPGQIAKASNFTIHTRSTWKTIGELKTCFFSRTCLIDANSLLNLDLTQVGGLQAKVPTHIQFCLPKAAIWS